MGVPDIGRWGTSPAEPRRPADCQKRPLRSRFRQQLTPSVRRLPFTSVINPCVPREERDTHDRNDRS
jgi:hypothetical protein